MKRHRSHSVSCGGTLMRSVLLFVEDFGHEEVLKAVISRLAYQYDIEVTINSRSATGGYGRVLRELEQYVGRMQQEPGSIPDLLVVATDANCNGYLERKKAISEKLPQSLQDLTVCAIPDPHIERWLLIDSSAFKAVLGQGCAAPPAKCGTRSLQETSNRSDSRRWSNAAGRRYRTRQRHSEPYGLRLR